VRPPIILVVIATLLVSSPVPVLARDPGGRVGSLTELDARLRSADADAVAPVAEAMASRGTPDAAARLAAFVRAGQPDAATDAVLLALQKHPIPAALPLLRDLTWHRRAAARRLAFGALAELEDAAVNPLLARGLRDSDPGVRGVSARALGRRGARDQLEVLFLAMSRGVPEAAAAVGRIGDAGAVARYHDFLGKLPIGVMLSGYERFLTRDDLSEDTRIEIVGRLGEVAGPTVKRFLERMLATSEWPRGSRLPHALRETAKRIDDRPGRVGERLR
jgi:hypothetical protein